MNNELGSIMKFLYDLKPCKVYTEEMPEDFQMPSLFIPPPFQFDFNHSVGAYGIEYTDTIKVFADSTEASYEHADLLAETIRKKRYLIPIVNLDGTLTGKVMRLNADIQVRELDFGVHSLHIRWNSRRPFDVGTYTKMGELTLKTTIKE